MPTPCFMDVRFVGTARQMTEAAKLCRDCPLSQLCGEVGIGEKEGVYGGMTPSHPIRVAFREFHDPDTECTNGHALEHYSTEVDGPGLNPIVACTRCAALLLQIAVAS